jgi:hypothetical protein
MWCESRYAKSLDLGDRSINISMPDGLERARVEEKIAPNAVLPTCLSERESQPPEDEERCGGEYQLLVK